MKRAMKIEFSDAIDWLEARQDQKARVVFYDPPYAVGTPVRGKEDGAAGSVFGPLSFMSRTLSLCAGTLMPGGIVAIFSDWRRMADLGYVASTVGLRPAACVAWTRKRPGTGGLFRSAWDPILIVSRGTPDAIDRAAIPNVIEADYPTKRTHPYGKPEAPFRHIMSRICRPGDLVRDPFAGSGVSGQAAAQLGLSWEGCDIDPKYARVAVASK